jgi:hypothetical protein
MAIWDDPQTRTERSGFTAATVGVPRATRDAGLRSYMLSVYNYMTSGVLLTGIVALGFASSGLAAEVLVTPLRWLIILAPLGFVIAMQAGLTRMSTATLQALFWGLSISVGLSLSSVFLVFTGVSIAQTFFAVAAGFGALSLWGYTTKKDLSGWGSFLIMGVFGLLAALLINLWFVQSLGFQMAISAVGVLIFAGLTAYDTQRIKSIYAYVAGSEMLGKAAIMGAVHLYLDFINMFTFLLQFTGNRR